MPNSERETEIIKFLSANGWGEAKRAPVPGDASSRRYERLTRHKYSAIPSKAGISTSTQEIPDQVWDDSREVERAVLMDAPEDKDGVVCPADATLEQRQELGYNAQARLAGSSLSAFICLATALTRRGFATPRTLAADTRAGLLLLEDLGYDLYARVLDKTPAREMELYQKAITCLAAIYRSSFAQDLKARGLSWHVGEYDDTALQVEADLFLQWYVPHFETYIPQRAKTEWWQIWEQSFTHLYAHPKGLALRDFHAENIFDLEVRVGLIDFQDALFAHPSYDLVSLLKDARRDVNPDIVEPLITQFCAEAGIENDDKFRAAYAVQGAQRNAKILGIFVRLAVRDGKANYLDLIPRVRAHFRNDLSHPALTDLKAWIKKYAPSALEESL